MEKLKRGIYAVLPVLVLSIFISPALSAAQEDCNPAKLRDLGIIVINCDGSSSTNKCSVGGSGNLDYSGQEILNTRQIEEIEKNKPVYLKAANQYNIPWQVIAAIHLRETNLSRSNPSNGQGIYQFLNGDGGPYPTGSVTDEEFERQTLFMAERLKTDYFTRTPIESNRETSATYTSPEAVKDMFFSYNGRSPLYASQASALGFDAGTEGYEGSPYVMNKADQPRDPNFNTTTWGQIKTDGGTLSYPANQMHGAFIQYTALGGVGGGNCDSSNLSVVEVAKRELAAGAKESDGTYLKYTGGREVDWCAYFVSWVFDEAGKPFENGPIPSVFDMRAYAHERGYYTLASEANYTPEPGDIVVFKENLNPYKSHVNILISYDSMTGTMTTIGGNESSMVKQANISRNLPALSGFIRIP